MYEYSECVCVCCCIHFTLSPCVIPFDCILCKQNNPFTLNTEILNLNRKIYRFTWHFFRLGDGSGFAMLVLNSVLIECGFYHCFQSIRMKWERKSLLRSQLDNEKKVSSWNLVFFSTENELIILAKIFSFEWWNFMELSDMKHSTLNKSMLLTKVELNLVV